MFNSAKLRPSLYVKNKDEQSTKLMLALTRAKRRVVVRFTGGCGYMSEEDAKGLYDLFVESFADFSGAILFGGTRMLKKNDNKTIVPGITEIPPLIRKKCPLSTILGVVPKINEFKLSDSGLIVYEESEESDYFTIINPDQDLCLLVQNSVDEGSPWEVEYKECMEIIDSLRTFAGWDSLLISYNGGAITEKEILDTNNLGWPILLIKGGGRKTDQYANDLEFLKNNSNVFVASKEVGSIRHQLCNLGVINKPSLKILRKANN